MVPTQSELLLNPFRIDEDLVYRAKHQKSLFHYEAMLACKIRLVCLALLRALSWRAGEA